jgi:hypothetical protein
LNEKGFGLYAEFRPVVEGWGGRGELRCDKILALRRKDIPVKSEVTRVGEAAESTEPFVIENASKPGPATDISNEQEDPDRKRPRNISLEEYEAALDQDTTFNDVDLGFQKPLHKHS